MKKKYHYCIAFFDYISNNAFRLVISMFSFLMIVHLKIFYFLNNYFNSVGSTSCNSFLGEAGLEEQIIVAVIIAPVLETIIFHFLLLELLLFLFKRSSYKCHFVILISAIIFSLTHRLEIQYLLSAFIGGMIFSSSYILAKNRNMIPVVVVFCIHSLTNLGVIVMSKTF